MSLNSLRDEAVSNLHIIASITTTQGSDIDIGEQFTVRFTIQNSFRGGEGEKRGHAHYNNVQLRVAGTDFASVVGGDRTIDVTNHLGYGHSATVNVTFLATAIIPASLFNWWPREPYAGVDVLADFDIVRFFKVVQTESFTAQIEQG